MRCQLHQELEVGEDFFQFLVSGHKAASAFAEQLGGAAGVGGEGVDTAGVALHRTQNRLEFGDSLSVGEIFDGGELRSVGHDGQIVMELMEPSAKMVCNCEP